MNVLGMGLAERASSLMTHKAPMSKGRSMTLVIRALAEMVRGYFGFSVHRRRAVAVAAVGLLLAACTGSQAPAASGPAPELTTLHPLATRMGEKFNVQPDGNAAISVEGQNFTRETVIIFGETSLQTTYGSDSVLTAVVPSALYAQVGTYPVYLRDGSKESNRLAFIVGP
jgi:hypothetical protein